MSVSPPTPHLHWDQEPTLKDPIVLAAFEGWNDAGEAASTAARYVRDHFDADEVGTIEAEDFFDFTVARPFVRLVDGRRIIEWPATTVHVASLPGATHDLVVLVGHEPQLRWRTFADHVVSVAQQVGARHVVTLGALLADVPHTRPVQIFGSTDNTELSERLGLMPSEYQGPTGIVGVLGARLRESGLSTASLWASVPAYVSSAPSPKAALALVEKISVVLGVPLPSTDLQIASAAYERQISDLVAEDERTAEFVEDLEANFDLQDAEDASIEDLFIGVESADVASISDDPESLVAEVEDFLRNNPGRN